MVIEKRDLIKMAILTVITFGIYFIYWTVKTKTALKNLGGDIPTAFLMVVPLANFYFWFKYSRAFAKYIRKNDEYSGYFAITSLMPFISMFVLQTEFNEY